MQLFPHSKSTLFFSNSLLDNQNSNKENQNIETTYCEVIKSLQFGKKNNLNFFVFLLSLIFLFQFTKTLIPLLQKTTMDTSKRTFPITMKQH